MQDEFTKMCTNCVGIQNFKYTKLSTSCHFTATCCVGISTIVVNLFAINVLKTV